LKEPVPVVPTLSYIDGWYSERNVGGQALDSRRLHGKDQPISWLFAVVKRLVFHSRCQPSWRNSLFWDLVRVWFVAAGVHIEEQLPLRQTALK